MILKNGSVVTSNGIIQSDIVIENGKISYLGKTEQDGRDCTGLTLYPGFVDTHVHGAFGTEFSSPEENFEKGLIAEAKNGITGVCCTIRCLPVEETISAIHNVVREYKNNRRGARILGIHLEGPFVSPNNMGSMNPENISKPSVEILNRFYQASEGLLKIITMAPELEGADEVIKYAHSLGITVSMGHTTATSEQAEKAYFSGVRQMTHTFNASPQIHHRNPGAVGYALTNDDIKCEAICDFVHLHPIAIKIIFNSKGDDKVNIISDSGVFAGLGDGEYFVAGKKRIVKNGICTLENGKIAGSCFTLLKGVQNLLSVGYNPVTVMKSASLNPSKTLGVSDSYGEISVGKFADICALNVNNEVAFTLVGGEIYE